MNITEYIKQNMADLSGTELKVILFIIMNPGPLKRIEIAEGTGVARKTVYCTLKSLMRRGIVISNFSRPSKYKVNLKVDVCSESLD